MSSPSSSPDLPDQLRSLARRLDLAANGIIAVPVYVEITDVARCLRDLAVEMEAG